jgi:YgiT-type zinc finger domain-containing protein
VGDRFQTEETFMKCVICKTGEVTEAPVEAEIKVGYDHLLVTVKAEACTQCGEPYYSPEVLRYLERLREEFARKEMVPLSVGKVYQIS